MHTKKTAKKTKCNAPAKDKGGRPAFVIDFVKLKALAQIQCTDAEIAAEMTGRCCYAMELSPAYVDVAVKRWEQFTGKKAVLEGAEDGRA